MSEIARFEAVQHCITIAEKNVEACEDWGGLIEVAHEEIANMNRVIDAAFALLTNEGDPLELNALRKVMESIGWRVR